MIMKDYITAQERLSFTYKYEYESCDCAGCGMSEESICQEQGIDDMDEYKVTLNSGEWYCHADCLRDSR
jgi:hypothetical protein